MNNITAQEPSPFKKRLFPNPSRSIRLLKISTTPTDNLTCTIEDFPLAKAPRFYTLSYTWGNPAVYTSTITTTSNPPASLPVLRTLLPFLRLITSHRDFNDQQWWWIDSLCINQKDDDERADQVDLMADIYKTSRSVIVWLGDTIEGDSDCSLAIEFLHHLSTLRLKDPKNDIERQEQQITRNNLWHPDRRPQWTAVGHLLARKWWSRVWTLQEFVLPHRGRICCGMQSINRSTFKIALENIHHTCISAIGTGVMHDLIPRGAFDAAFNRRRVQQLYAKRERSPHDDGASGRQMSLVSLLAYMGNAECKNAQDRVFSVRGLIGERDLKMLGKPEYVTDVGTLFRRVVVRVWREYHCLDIICFAHIFSRFATSSPSSSFTLTTTEGKEEPPLPSWTPDWRTPMPSISPVPLMASQPANPSVGNFRPLHSSIWSSAYDASGPRLRKEAIEKVTFDNEFTELVCWGVVLSSIDELGSLEGLETRCGSFECAGKGAHALVKTSLFSHEDTAVEDDEEETLRALTRCLTLNRRDKYFCHAAPSHYATDFKSLCRDALSPAHSPVDITFSTWFNENRALCFGRKSKTLEDLITTNPSIRSLSSPSAITLVNPSTSAIHDSRYADEFEYEDEEIEHEKGPETFLARFNDTIVKKSRRVFSGRYPSSSRSPPRRSRIIGMAPCRARIGDVVAVLGACSVPVVLRRKEDKAEKWEFVGEAYVDGFMGGEVEALEGAGREFKVV